MDTTIALSLSWRLVSSTMTATGFFLCGARITLRARFSQNSAMYMRGLEMKRRSRVSPVSGIPKNVRPRATALRARDSALATPNLNAARTAAWDLMIFWNTLLIWLVQWRNGFGWRAGGSSFGAFVVHRKDGALSPASQPFYTPPEKRKAVSIKEEGTRWLWAARIVRRLVDSRFRGNDGRAKRGRGFIRSRFALGCASLSESGFSGLAGFSGFRFARLAPFAITENPVNPDSDLVSARRDWFARP